MTRRIALMLAAVAAILQSPVLLGQGQQAPQTPGVTFQVEVNYVDVDVVVTDELGQFVTGLTRDDFEVFEDGKPQKIDTFSLVEIPLEKQQVVVGYVRSRPMHRRIAGRSTAAYVFVLDDLDVSAMRGAQVRDARANSFSSTWGRTTWRQSSTRAAAPTRLRNLRPIASC